MIVADEAEDCIDSDMWASRQDIINIESIANPLVIKEELQRKLKEAEQVVKDLTKQLAAL